jgi:hypothetical protein
VPRLPPRVLTFALRALGRQALVDRAFGWYLDQAHPAFIDADRSGRDRWHKPQPVGQQGNDRAPDVVGAALD